VAVVPGTRNEVVDMELRVSRYDVLVDDPIYPDHTITIELRNCDPVAWAVCHCGECLRTCGKKWTPERSPSNRTDHFLKHYRFTSLVKAQEGLAIWLAQGKKNAR